MAETLSKASVQRVRGLKKVEICELVNGAIPENAKWFEIGETVPDSAKISRGEGQQVDEYIEEQDSPTDSWEAQRAIRFISWQTRNFHGEVLEKVFGGTYTPATASADGIWEEPAVAPDKEHAVRLVSSNSIKLAASRTKISITEDTTLAKSGSASMMISAKQLSDPSATKSGFSISFPQTGV